MDSPWRIELLGWLRATLPGREVSRFQTQKTGALLAYLAYHRHRSHPRGELVELLWPECDRDASRHRLCQALYSLRRQLEPPGIDAGTVIVANKASVQLNPVACVTDVAQFEAALRAAESAPSARGRVQHLTAAAEVYRGELLPGYFDAWVLPERQRLAELFLQSLQALVALLEHEGDRQQALQWARRAVAADPLWEEGQHALIRVLARTGRTEVALRQYAEWERLLAQELGAAPAPEIRAFVIELREGTARVRPESNETHSELAEETTGDRSSPPGTGTGEQRSPLSSPRPVAASTPGQLPLQFTRFFGRENEVVQLQKLLGERQMVTLTGPGGTGKTRLAVRVAQQLREAFPGGVWFVPLLDLADPRLIADEIREVLCLPRSPEIEPIEQVVSFLSRQPALVVLDNFEHLVEQGVETVRALLERIEGLTLLVTSRQRLGLEGERQFPVPPLPVPGVETLRRSGVSTDSASPPNTPMPQHLTALVHCPSVALFVDRAQAVRPDFQVTKGNASAVAELCQRLEGLPLATELAAARAGALTPQQMLARLQQRLELLATRLQTADPRHRSLRATLDWSYHLLPPKLQRFFVRLSVFRRGWSLEAAEAVCGGGADGWAAGVRDPATVPTPNPQCPTPTLDYLEQLRHGSLVLAEEGGDEMRFRLLETLREYGEEQLSPEERAILARQHAAYYLTLAEEADPRLRGPEQAIWLARLEREHPNLLAALSWFEATGNLEDGLRLAGALWWFWYVRGDWIGGRARLARLLALAEDAERQDEGTHADRQSKRLSRLGAGDESSPPPAARITTPATVRLAAARARALHGAGVLTRELLGDGTEARALHQESLAIWRELGDRRGIAEALGALGHVESLQNNADTAWAVYAESLAIWRELGDPGGIAELLDAMAPISETRDGVQAARALYQEALMLNREWGDRAAQASNLTGLGWLARAEGEHAAARALFEESVAMQRESGNRSDIHPLCGLGLTTLEQGDYKTARSIMEEILEIDRSRLNRGGAVLIWLGQLEAAQGNYPGARAWYAEFLSQNWGAGPARKHYFAEGLLGLGDLECLEGDYTAARRCFEQALAVQRELGDWKRIPTSLEKLAGTAAVGEQPARAARLFGAAEAVRQTAGAPVRPPHERADFDRQVALARCALGEATFAAVWEEGRRMPLDRAIAEALDEAGTLPVT